MLILPQMKINFYEEKIFFDEIILIGGGREPNIKWFNQIKMDRDIICIDRGINFCRVNDILPKILIGDFDSAEKKSFKWAVDKKIKIESHPVDKDFTDTQLALEKISDDKFAIITGVFGGRSDHLFSTIFTCANAKIKNCLADECEIILFLNGGENLSIEFLEKPLALSLLPMSEICRNVSVDGVHWNLNSATLKQNYPNAISNRVESKFINISIGTGKLAIYFCFDEKFF